MIYDLYFLIVTRVWISHIPYAIAKINSIIKLIGHFFTLQLSFNVRLVFSRTSDFMVLSPPVVGSPNKERQSRLSLTN